MDSISESYADELFGMLVKEYGLETILNRMKIINGDDYLLGSIASVIQRRALQ
ncbi:STAS-like domain-containing protein [Acinetobacter baumannii]